MRKRILIALAIGLSISTFANAQRDPGAGDSPLRGLAEAIERLVPTDPGLPALDLLNTETMLHTSLLTGETNVCWVSNVGPSPLFFEATLHDLDGADIDSEAGMCESPLPPGASCFVSTSIGAARCSIRVFGPRDSVRAILIASRADSEVFGTPGGITSSEAR